MTPVDAPSPARDAAHQNHPPPALPPHARQARLGDDKLTPRINLQGEVPVVFLNVLDVSDAAACAGISDQDGDGLVSGADGRVGEHVGDQQAGGFARGEVCAGRAKELFRMKPLEFVNEGVCFFLGSF